MRARSGILLLALALPAAAEGLRGSWHGELDGAVFELVLGEHGEGKFGGEEVEYRLEGAQLVVELDGETVRYALKRGEDTLTLSGGELDEPLELERDDADEALQTVIRAR